MSLSSIGRGSRCPTVAVISLKVTADEPSVEVVQWSYPPALLERSSCFVPKVPAGECRNLPHQSVFWTLGHLDSSPSRVGGSYLHSSVMDEKKLQLPHTLSLDSKTGKECSSTELIFVSLILVGRRIGSAPPGPRRSLRRESRRPRREVGDSLHHR